MWALYGFSGFVYFLAYYVVRHRRRVIRGQLVQVFPDMPEGERTRIHKRFLKNFCDVLVEVLKSAMLRPEQMSARIRILNLPVARACLDAGQSIMLVTSHLCNWEWLLQGITLQLGYPVMRRTSRCTMRGRSG